MVSVLYLLDANVLIDANRDYYPLDRVPEFWNWLLEMSEHGIVKIPQEVYEEVVLPSPSRPDALVDWLKSHNETLVLGESVAVDLVAHVTAQCYGDDLTESEIGQVGRDPFLIAYALADIQGRCIVTTERSRPSRTRANRHLPDVATESDVDCINTFDLIRALDFRTDWRTGP